MVRLSRVSVLGPYFQAGQGTTCRIRPGSLMGLIKIIYLDGPFSQPKGHSFRQSDSFNKYTRSQHDRLLAPVHIYVNRGVRRIRKPAWQEVSSAFRDWETGRPRRWALMRPNSEHARRLQWLSRTIPLWTHERLWKTMKTLDTLDTDLFHIRDFLRGEMVRLRVLSIN